MKLYCKIENDVVVSGPGLLPVDLGMKSDFELLELGWKVAERIVPETFDDYAEVMLPLEYTIHPYKVVVTFNKRNKTSEELTQQNIDKLAELKNIRDTLIVACNDFINNTEEFNKISPTDKDTLLAYKEQLLTLLFEDVDFRNVRIPELPVPLHAPMPTIKQ